ncbi:ArsR/SmtB family transcription factor [Yinghuangia seranimata]|uniref:ArsR/SmtB family transcription factor n=1 Tax=Yinghuangia seranimata TaxID=408067 RepID=UPI00248C9AA9|nr:helix-turn-helix domain-containing protein [Yinghuangia seranimata]MDI2131107.1 helix-turn-helix domain-containing protein [Yinghuangia seranimata]
MPSSDHSAPQLAALAGLLADATRATFCLALLDGRAWTGGELARYAGVAPSTASAHLSQLVAGGLLVEERQGRHRYIRIANPQTAQLIEDLAAFSGPPPAPTGTLKARSVGTALARARTCYDHLAGRLGIAITDALTARGLLVQDSGFALTDDGLGWFAAQGMDLAASGGSRRPVARPCLDWTERRPHLSGLSGAALCRHALEEGWCVRIGSQRALKVTDEGTRRLHELLGIEPEELELAPTGNP